MATDDDAFEGCLHDAILAHVELYRLTIAPAVERLFFSQVKVPAGQARRLAFEALDHLVRAGKLVARKFPKVRGAAAGEFYYLPPAAKSGKQSGDAQAIDFDLQTLWFSTLLEHRFHRLSVAETRRLFATPPHHHVRHVIGDAGDGPFVARVYPSKVAVKETVTRLKQFIGEARGKHGLASWVDAGDYGFCILVDNEKKVSAVIEAVAAHRPGAGALADQARILAAFAPTAGNVSEAIGKL